MVLRPSTPPPKPETEVHVDAAVIRCEACGGPVALDDIRCRSCGSQVATLACPNCMALVSIHARHCEHCGTEIVPVESLPTDLPCPECKSAKLTQTTLGDVAVDQCLACGGVWLDQQLFDRVSSTKETQGLALSVLPAASSPHVTPTQEVHYRPCPLCSKMMNRYNYARISGVIVDGCRTHGLWFDRDELRQVLEFIAGGGLEKSREREIARLGQEQRTTAQMARIEMSASPSSYGEYSAQSGIHLGGGFLASLVEGLMDHFIV